MTTITVNNAAQLTSALQTVRGGDTINLAGGNYGDFYINKSFASDITIKSLSSSAPASFHSLNITSSSHLKIDGVLVNFTPTASTLAFSPAVTISDSSFITFANSAIKAGAAINGVSPSATVMDSTQNILGFPTGYGMSIARSTNVVVNHNDISQVHKGIVLNGASNLTISNNDIHDIRTSGIVGTGDKLTIDGNHIHDSNPWHWGSGDHADFLALWTTAGRVGPSTDIKITNNLFEQGKGTAVLGMWMQGGAAGFSNVTISGNAFLDGNFQGISLFDVANSKVDHNVLLQTSGDSKAAPGILLAGGVKNVTVSDNIAGSVNDMSKSTGAAANVIGSNQLVQRFDLGKAGFYGDDLVSKIASTLDLTSFYGVALSGLTPSAIAAAAAKALAVEATAPAGLNGAGIVVVGDWTGSRLVGTAGNDTITGKVSVDTLVGGAGDDTYIVSSTATVIIEKALSGTDTVIAKGDYTLKDNLENLTISPGTVNGWVAIGNSANNVIKGNLGDNYIDGGAGADTLFGDAGKDVLNGGIGNDRLTGGTGLDVFKFERGGGKDVVTDFNKVDHDAIDISSFLKAGLKAVLTDVGYDVSISFSTGDSIVLTGVHAKDLIATTTGFTI